MLKSQGFLLILLINVKMAFYFYIYGQVSCVEYENSFITSGPGVKNMRNILN